ncbi:MAG: VPDSG-CTERM sorting domain-containing protein [Akkermansiaceae bacterium]|nr:VPDSG-CTERM sorting domain-containing protein [Verrucomicrobiales bacterium]
MKTPCLIIASSLLFAGATHAGPINITIHDSNSAAGYIGTGAGLEDNETEPGTVKTDAWDHEALGYTAATKTLDVIGTFNFAQGVVAHNKTYRAGAIFIGTGNSLPSANSWSFAYVLNFNNNTYSLFNSFNIVLPTDVPISSPWTISPTAGAVATGSFGYQTGLGNPDGFGLSIMGGGNPNIHNMISLSLNDLSPTVRDDFWVHVTPECGNDTVRGHYTSVPDAGATATLLGLALTGLACVRRKFSN